MNASYTLRPRARRDLMEQKVAQRYFKAVDQTCARLACISHGTLRVALWRRLFSRPRRLSSRRMDREPRNRMSRHECRDGCLRGCATNSLRSVG